MRPNQPICKTCGVLWVDHMGIEGTCAENAKLRQERDEARRRTNSILTEIDCRIEHGAESNGHLEAIRSLFKEDTNE